MNTFQQMVLNPISLSHSVRLMYAHHTKKKTIFIICVFILHQDQCLLKTLLYFATWIILWRHYNMVHIIPKCGFQ